MATETILQHWIFTNFILPFLLIFFIVFGGLEKTKIFGEKKQLNAFIAFVIGLIFVGAIFPKLVVANLILFLTVAPVTMFVILLLYGFVAGDKGLDFEKAPKLKVFVGIVVIVSVVIAILWATGVGSGVITDFLFNRLSSDFWTNAAFIVAIIIALALILSSVKSGGKP